MAKDRKRAISDLKEKSSSSDGDIKDALEKIQKIAKYLLFPGTPEERQAFASEIAKIRDEKLE